jgi:hypothetical protein
MPFIRCDVLPDGGVRLNCTSCGTGLDYIKKPEVVSYFVFVEKTQDYPYCEDCDQSADDTIHPLVTVLTKYWLADRIATRGEAHRHLLCLSS